MRTTRFLGILLLCVIALGLVFSPMSYKALAQEKEAVEQETEEKAPVTVTGKLVDTEEGLAIDTGGEIYLVVGEELIDYLGAKVKVTGSIEKDDSAKASVIFVEEYEIVE